MNKIQRLLEEESSKLLLINQDGITHNDIRKLFDEINNFVADILEWKINAKELEKSYLTPTLVFIGKIEKLHKIISSKKIDQFVLKLDFNHWIDFLEFFDYYNFATSDDEIRGSDSEWNTTSLFSKLQASKNSHWIYLLNQEAYEHEDDTDDSTYHLILRWL
ncbi:MAG: hypothetical protein ACD_3C00135G0002 [uncultured bacterium (gcode 4)]|uniref:Uncharacterized protein n=1 Tax=uncultured bacterium (gcode 4) TaxID=1234023 RepID=K2GCB1_9BACT|nr:MAG: hypothetical protein ACD_3C00135G0002 [uncultured bacterium (gcode 4)]